MTLLLKRFFLVFLIALVCQPSDGFSAKKKRRGPVYAAFVVDDYTGKVLHKTNADARTYPASLTKVMTLYMLFEALKTKKVTLNTKMKVSKHASGQKPSKLWLKPGSTLSVRDALLALTVKSANDVSVVVAEHLGGAEKKFAALMTQKARKLGMKYTVFKNASGLPNRLQVTTARDMATMFRALHRHFPSYYRYFKHKHFTFRGQKHRAHTKLLRTCQGVDGVKTGFINASGFNLVASAKRKNTRLFAVVMGGKTGRWRDKRIENLINQYFPKAITLNANRPSAKRYPQRTLQDDMLWARNLVPPHKPFRFTKPEPLQVKAPTSIPTPQAPEPLLPFVKEPDPQFEALIAQKETSTTSASAPDIVLPDTPDLFETVADDPDEVASLNNTLDTDDSEADEGIPDGLPSRHDSDLLANIIANESYDDLDAINRSDKSWAAQFGAFADESEAQNKADLLVTLIPNLPGKVTVTPAKHRRTPLYRARLVQLTKIEAETVCKKMRFHSIPCLPLKN